VRGEHYEGYPTLKIDTNFLEDQQVNIKVEFDASQLADAKQRAARKIARQTKIPGFRPGKAPYGIVLRTVGETVILEEALEILVDEQYPKVIEESQLKPYGPGRLENVISMDPPIFEFVVPLEAEVTLGDYHAIRLPYELPQVQDAEVEKILEDLRDRQAVLESVERPSQPGDQVFIRLSGERMDPEEGESATLVTDRPMPVIIAADNTVTTSEWPFPGFSRTLIGLSDGDQKTIRHIFAEDAEYVNLRGKSAEFQIIVESIKSRTLPDLNDEFARTVGEYETLSALQTEIRTSLETERKDEYDDNFNDQIAAELFKLTEWKYPPQMLEHEIELFQDQLENRLAQQNMDLETYIKIRQLNESGLKEEIKPLAEQRMKRTLVLLEIAHQQDIKVSEEELETESMRTLDHLSHSMPQDKIRKTLTDDFVRGMISNIGADLLMKRTWEYLHSVVRGDSSGTAGPEPAVETPKKKLSKKKEISNESK
jgi:trigger factor